MRSLTLFTVVVALTGFGSSAGAAPITYVLSGATFVDGGVAVGSFIYDNGSFSAININVSGGTTANLSPAQFTAVNPSLLNFPGAAFFVTSAADLTHTPGLTFGLPPGGLGNGFTLQGFENTCLTATCDAAAAPSRAFAAGSANATPEPRSVLLLAFGTALLGCCRWRAIRQNY